MPEFLHPSLVVIAIDDESDLRIVKDLQIGFQSIQTFHELRIGVDVVIAEKDRDLEISLQVHQRIDAADAAAHMQEQFRSAR